MSNAGVVADLHRERYGKKAEDVIYTEEVCPLCNTRVDEFGYCACGGQAD
ncbi:hypothetical protein HRbin01_01658 [archaeon HR01]|nr:hypothetical protein HRbin01_01658 [archaeon HR01]